MENDDEEGGRTCLKKNFRAQLKSLGKADLKYSYTKITNNNDGQKLVDNIHNLLDNDIKHHRVQFLRHAQPCPYRDGSTERTGRRRNQLPQHYPKLVRTFALHQALRRIADKKVTLIMATDHGSVREYPGEVIGDKQTTANLRTKHGRNLNYEPGYWHLRSAGSGPAGSECEFLVYLRQGRSLSLLP